MSLLLGRPGAHVDLFKNGEDGERTLISTTRPCVECGQPLVGVIVPVGKEHQAHAHCRESRKVIHAGGR